MNNDKSEPHGYSNWSSYVLAPSEIKNENPSFMYMYRYFAYIFFMTFPSSHLR